MTNIGKMANPVRITKALALLLVCCALPADAIESLKVHGIFRSNRVLLRDKPIDVWVMDGQSNMAIGLKTIYEGQFDAPMAHLPLMRQLWIQSGAESEYVETDLQTRLANTGTQL
jgi:hypothetical protein